MANLVWHGSAKKKVSTLVASEVRCSTPIEDLRRVNPLQSTYNTVRKQKRWSYFDMCKYLPFEFLPCDFLRNTILSIDMKTDNKPPNLIGFRGEWAMLPF